MPRRKQLKETRWVLVSRSANTNEYNKLELLWFRQSTHNLNPIVSKCKSNVNALLKDLLESKIVFVPRSANTTTYQFICSGYIPLQKTTKLLH